MKIASVDSGTNSTALYAYNLSQKDMRKKVTEDNSEEIRTEFFPKFYENYEIFFQILWKLWNPQIQEAQQVQDCEENHIKVIYSHITQIKW